MSSLSFVTTNLGTEGVAVSDESIKVSCGNFGIIDPLGEKLMINVRGRNRAGEMIAFKGRKALEYRRSFLAGLDVFLIELEKVSDRKPNFDRRALKHAGKGWEASEPGVGKAGWASAIRGRSRGWAGQALEVGIKLVAVRGHRGRPRGQGRSEGRRSRSGGGEMRNRRGGTSGGGRMEG